MPDLEQALQSIRLFLEDAEPLAKRYLGNPHCLQGEDLHLTAGRMAADVLNALVLLRVVQPGGRAFGPLQGATPKGQARLEV